jgi:hypothetical protein
MAGPISSARERRRLPHYQISEGRRLRSRVWSGFAMSVAQVIAGLQDSTDPEFEADA